MAFSYDQPIDENDESNVKANEGEWHINYRTYIIVFLIHVSLIIFIV